MKTHLTESQRAVAAARLAAVACQRAIDISNPFNKRNSDHKLQLFNEMEIDPADPRRRLCPECDEGYLIKDLEIDRYPLPGRQGGEYAWGNVRLVCHHCNVTRDASEISKERMSKPEARARQSEISKKLWEDPEHRTKCGISMSKAQEKLWANPEHRASQSEAQKKGWAKRRARLNSNQSPLFQPTT